MLLTITYCYIVVCVTVSSHELVQDNHSVHCIADAFICVFKWEAEQFPEEHIISFQKSIHCPIKFGFHPFYKAVQSHEDM